MKVEIFFLRFCFAFILSLCFGLGYSQDSNDNMTTPDDDDDWIIVSTPGGGGGGIPACYPWKWMEIRIANFSTRVRGMSCDLHVELQLESGGHSFSAMSLPIALDCEPSICGGCTVELCTGSVSFDNVDFSTFYDEIICPSEDTTVHISVTASLKRVCNEPFSGQTTTASIPLEPTDCNGYFPPGCVDLPANGVMTLAACKVCGKKPPGGEGGGEGGDGGEGEGSSTETGFVRLNSKASTNDEMLQMKEDSGSDDIQLSPNPANHTLTILNMADIKMVEMVNQMGQKFSLDLVHLNKNSAVLDISHLQNGAYFIKMTSLNGEKIIRPFVKQ